MDAREAINKFAEALESAFEARAAHMRMKFSNTNEEH